MGAFPFLFLIHNIHASTLNIIYIYPNFCIRYFMMTHLESHLYIRIWASGMNDLKRYIVFTKSINVFVKVREGKLHAMSMSFNLHVVECMRVSHVR